MARHVLFLNNKYLTVFTWYFLHFYLCAFHLLFSSFVLIFPCLVMEKYRRSDFSGMIFPTVWREGMCLLTSQWIDSFIIHTLANILGVSQVQATSHKQHYTSVIQRIPSVGYPYEFQGIRYICARRIMVKFKRWCWSLYMKS
jgi:hypothetical protein